jgi:dihydroorotate dehydrogenase
MYDFIYRNLLTRTDAERSHHLALRLLTIGGNLPPVRATLGALAHVDTTGMSIKVLNQTFEHPLGLAAGFDKDACCLRGLNALGFSFVEVGSVTPRPQPGNEGKRIFRLTDDHALINRLGFPSLGVDAVVQQLSRLRNYQAPIGISLGKNKETPLADAHNDYRAVLDKLYPYGDFFVVNISSPNTADLRKLQTAEFLGTLLSSVKAHMATLVQGQPPKPLLIKIAPDLTWQQLDNLIDICLRNNIDGIIATNTDPGNRIMLNSPQRTEAGGLSGAPLRKRSTEIVRYIHQRTQGKLTIIGVGGVFTGDDVWEKLAAGASLVQAYTGFIYQGPLFVKKALSEIRQRMDREGIRDLREIIGVYSDAK